MLSKIRVSSIPGEPVEVDFTEGMTLRQALVLANKVVEEGVEVRVNSKIVTDLDQVLTAKDKILVIIKTTGN